MPELPDGTVTYLFTDIEGSTRLWEHHPDEMRAALSRHDALLRAIVEENEGVVFATAGDGFRAAFATADAAVAAARDAQRALAVEPWPESARIKVRMALHTGAADLRDGDYFGQPLNRAARLMSAGHGGQVLLSLATQELVRDGLPAGVVLRDLGDRRLKDLVRPERVYQLVVRDLPGDFPPLNTLDSRAHNLPIQLTSLVGREREMKEVKDLLGSSRLVTLTGAGGAGKTRLALQVGADRIDDFQDGVWLVELASLTDPGLVPQAVARVLRVKEQPGMPLTQTLADELKAKGLLLLLDNCEHLVAAVAELSQALLSSCEKVRVLATSREVLRVPGEASYRVPSLATPDPKTTVGIRALTQYAAVQLFIDRAVAVQPAFAVNNANAPAVASICQRLDGIPLALELAAARLRAMSVEDLHRRLDQRFRLLTEGSRTALPRQQTLRATIDWSYDLLSGAEQAMLGRVSVFGGGWTLLAAEQVCTDDAVKEEDVVDLLASLANKSIVIAEEREGAIRYRMLETVRQYAHDRLAETGGEALWRNRHLARFVAWTQAIEPLLKGAGVEVGLAQLETEHDNLRAALDWSMSDGGDAVAGLRIAAAIWWFWMVHGHLREARQRLGRLLAATNDTKDRATRAKALRGAGALAREQLDFPAAEALHTESLAIRREIGDRSGAALTLGSLGTVAVEQGDYDVARRLQEESLAIQRELGDRASVAMVSYNLAEVDFNQGDYAKARERLEESLAIYKELGNRWGISLTLNHLGRIASARGETAQALSVLEQALLIGRELGNSSGIAWSLEAIANVALAMGAPERAARLCAFAQRLREDIGKPQYGSDRDRYDEHVAALRKAMDASAFEQAWQAGSAMTLDQAIEYVLGTSAERRDRAD